MLGGKFLNYKKEKNISWEYPFAQIREFFCDTDVIFGNLECTLSNRGAIREDKSSILYAPPNSLEALKHLNYDILCLGNNHITDYGLEGLIETINVLEKESFLFFGAGKNIFEANKEVVLEKNGQKICFSGYSTNEKHVNSVMASETSEGCIYYDKHKIIADINRLKQEYDIICISLHWGYEYYEYPSPDQIELAHQIIDAGAHILVGHHPHIIQGYEQYKNGVIFYSLGNFFFPDFMRKNGTLHKWNDINKYSLVPKCTFENGKLKNVDFFYSYMNDNYQLEFLNLTEKRDIHLKFTSISDNLKLEYYHHFWNTYNGQRSNELSYVSNFNNLLISAQIIKKLGVQGSINRISLKNIVNLLKLILSFVRSLVSKFVSF